MAQLWQSRLGPKLRTWLFDFGFCSMYLVTECI